MNSSMYRLLRRVAISVLVLALGVDPPAVASAAPSVVESAMAGLAHRDPKARASAANALASAYPDATRAVPVLVDALEDDDAGVRNAASRCLDALGRAALPTLSRYLADESTPGRAEAFDVLSLLMGLGIMSNVKAWDLAAGAAGTPTPEVTYVAAVASGQRNFLPYCPVLVHALTSSRQTERDLAAAALGILGWEAALISRGPTDSRDPLPREPALDTIVARIQEVGPKALRSEWRWLGVRVLGVAAARWPPLVGVLARTVTEVRGDPHEYGVRASAAQALGLLGASGVSAAASLERMFPDHPDVAGEALARIGRPALLEKALSGDDVWLRFQASMALTKWGPFRPAALPVLVGVIETGGGEAAMQAAKAISARGAEAREAAPALAALLEDQDYWKRTVAAIALVGIDGPRGRTLEALTREIDMEWPEDLEDPGARDDDRFPRESWLALAVMEELRRVRGGAEAAYPALERRVRKSKDPAKQVGAVRTLGTAGPKAAAAVPVLVSLLRERVGVATKPGLAPLARYVEEGEAYWITQELLRAVVEALGRIGKPAAEAVPLLEAVTKGADDRLRYRAARALTAIRGG
jgi:HEAT repeat protein